MVFFIKVSLFENAAATHPSDSSIDRGRACRGHSNLQVVPTTVSSGQRRRRWQGPRVDKMTDMLPPTKGVFLLWTARTFSMILPSTSA